MAVQANMNIQPVFNKQKAVIYMFSYSSKSEDQCSASIKQATNNENNEIQIFMTQWKQLYGLIQWKYNVLLKRQRIILFQNYI